MSILDPSLIAATGQINDPMKGATLRELLARTQLTQQQAQMGQQQMQGQNTLRSIFANPKSLDPATGMPTTDAMRQIMAVDPSTGMQLRQQQSQLAEQDLRRQGVNADLVQKVTSLGLDAADESLGVYDAAIKAGQSPQAAQAQAQAVYGDHVDKLGKSGLISNQQFDLIPKQFDPVKSRAALITAKDRAILDDKKQTEDRDDAKFKTQLDLDKARLGLESERVGIEAANAGKKGWSLGEVDDPANPGKKIPVRVNADTGEVAPIDAKGLTKLGGSGGTSVGAPENVKFVDKDGKPQTAMAIYDKQNKQWLDAEGGRPIEGTGIEKVSMSPPRSPQAMALQKYLEENPNATSADIQKFSAQGVARSAAQRSLEAGPIGAQLKSLGVAVDHLNTLRDLNAAFNGGDEKTIAAAKAAWEREFGTPAPTNMDLAAQFVAPELIKAIEGSPGGVAERDELAASFKAARGQSNVTGAIDTAEALMGGQLNGMRNQLVKVDKLVSDDEFSDMIPSVALDAMKRHQTASGQQGGISVPQAAIDHLKGDKDPNAQKNFDAIFGAGAAARVLGK